MIGFGIDLAGYSTGKTSLAVVKVANGSFEAALLRDSALSTKRRGDARLDEALNADVAVLKRCLAVGRVAVDIPIDLQGLPFSANPQYIWQLTNRPIDRAVGAMPPLADRIGAPVARFAAIMRAGDLYPHLGEKLFEAYPAGALRMLNIKAGRYKGPPGADALASLCANLGISPAVENDDDIDAIICAITAATPAEDMNDDAAFKIDGPVPKGFRIPKRLPASISVRPPASFEPWMQNLEASR